MRPNIEQFIETIRKGDDNKSKNILLNFDGTFELGYNFQLEDSHKYVGRSETLDKGTDYVGIKASEDMNYIKKMYATFLEAWIKYKKHNITGQYLDIYPIESVEELEKKISEIENK